MAEIIYEDNHLLIAAKPQGQLTQSDETGDLSLHDELKGYIKEKYQKPGDVYLGLVHRLDRPVGGLVAFARTSKAASRLSEQLRTRQMDREYLCVVEGSLPAQSGSLTNWLLQDDSGFVRVCAENAPGAKKAVLHYRLLGQSGGQALYHIRLDSGRKHQIRVQLQNAGCPILYDMRYGKGVRGRDIALWGALLTLFHPTKKERMVFASPPNNPAFAPWQKEIDSFLQDALFPPH